MQFSRHEYSPLYVTSKPTVPLTTCGFGCLHSSPKGSPRINDCFALGNPMKGYGVAVEPFPCVGKTLLQLCLNLKTKQFFSAYVFIEVEMFYAYLRQRLNVKIFIQRCQSFQFKFLR
jgi:hypothetical protein